MEIVLVRHAQPDWEPDKKAVDDPDLTAYGHEQAQRCAQALAGEQFDAFYASPLKRVQQTAAPIAEALQMQPKTQDWLREIELPAMAGDTPEQVQDFFREAHARDLPGWWQGFPGGENYSDFYQRVSTGLEQLFADRHDITTRSEHDHRLWRIPRDAGRTLIVAHEGTNSALLTHLLGVDAVPWAPIRFSTSWAGITQVRSANFPAHAADMWGLDYFNRTHHMAGMPKVPDSKTKLAQTSEGDVEQAG